MLKKLFDILFVLLIVLGLSGLVGCASGGGSAGLVQDPTPPPPSTSTGSNDERIAFDDFTRSWSETIYGDVSITYGMSPYTTTGLPSPTEKFKIADYGFLRITANGQHNGSSEGNESTSQGPWLPGGYWFEADLNGDEHVDMYFIGHMEGAVDWTPGSLLMAFINDGNGHYRLAPEVFENGEFPCIAGGGSMNDKTDPNDVCGFQTGNNYPVIADFNNDGMTDVFTPSMLFLSDGGVIKNKSHDNLPDIFFQEHIGSVFVHRVDDGDADGDGDLDLFLPVFDSTEQGYMIDGSTTCSGCNEELPWMMLINDGTGNFSLNTNFDTPQTIQMGDEWNRIWATSTTLDDFNNDGLGDIAVGWESPSQAQYYGWLENSAGNVYLNAGNNDWRTTPINLPESWFGANGIGVDMDSFDFDNDGFTDIILQTTKHNPYYQGNVIQFFLNDGTGNFTDVTTTVNPDYAKYENGSGNGYWNGGGLLHVLDFDHDGDLDIVSTNGRSYVLLNSDGVFNVYDDFPTFDNGDGGVLWPVEIDGKYWYDFISSREIKVDSDTAYTDFFQVLDPPAQAELMLIDLYTKPNAYRDLVGIASRLNSDAFYFARNNNNDFKLFSTNSNNVDSYGFITEKENFGFGITKTTGVEQDSSHSIDYVADTVTLYKNYGNTFFGLGITNTYFENSTKTVMFGEGTSEVDALTFAFEVSYNQPLPYGFDATIGTRVQSTTIDNFLDEGDMLPLEYEKQRFNTNLLVAGLGYKTATQRDGYVSYFHADVEHIRYLGKEGHLVNFSQGGTYTPTTVYNYDEQFTNVSLNVGIVVSDFVVNLSIADRNNFKSTILSVGFNF